MAFWWIPLVINAVTSRSDNQTGKAVTSALANFAGSKGQDLSKSMNNPAQTNIQ